MGSVVEMEKYRLLSDQHRRELMARKGKAIANLLIDNHEKAINPPIMNGLRVDGVWLDEYDEMAEHVLKLPPETQ